MKRKFLIAFLLMAIVGLSLPTGYCIENRWGQVDTYRQLSKVMPGYLQAAGTTFGGATSMTTTGIAVPLTYAIVFKNIAATGPTYSVGTLADGTRGQLLKIFITEVQSSGTWVLTPTTATGFTSLTFNAVADEVTLLYVDDTVGWITTANTSVTVNSPY